jgi:hypothetical protein
MVVPLASIFSEAAKLHNIPAGQESLSLAEGSRFSVRLCLSTLVTTPGFCTRLQILTSESLKPNVVKGHFAVKCSSIVAHNGNGMGFVLKQTAMLVCQQMHSSDTFPLLCESGCNLRKQQRY